MTKHLVPLTPTSIDKLLSDRDTLLTRRDGLYDIKRVKRIDAQLATVPPGTNNAVDLALGRPEAKLTPRVVYVQHASGEVEVDLTFGPSPLDQAYLDIAAQHAAQRWSTDAERDIWIKQGIENGKRLAEAMRGGYEGWRDQTADYREFNGLPADNDERAELTDDQIAMLEARTAETATEAPTHDGMWK